MGSDRIISPGFVSEYEYSPDTRGHNNLNSFYTGYFRYIEGDLTSMVLFDDMALCYHPMRRVTLMSSAHNVNEGKERFPRPWIFKRTDDEIAAKSPIGSKLVSMGEKLLIAYGGGNILNPIVIGSLNSLAVVDCIANLQIDPDNLDRQIERYENSKYAIQTINDGAGNVQTVLVGKGKVAGRGNALVEIIGATDTDGNAIVQVTGNVSIRQMDSEGVVTSSVVMDGTKGAEKITITDRGGAQIELGASGLKIKGTSGALENAVYGDKLISLLGEIIDGIKGFSTLPAATGVSSLTSLETKAIFNNISTKLNDILTS